MIDVYYKKKGLCINARWFCKDLKESLLKSKGQIVFFHGINENIEEGLNSEQNTLITNLSEEEEILFKKIKKNFKYEIKRAKKENVQCILYNSEELKNNNDLIETFEKEYIHFMEEKGVKLTYNRVALNEYIKNNNVYLTKAFGEESNFAQHIYVCDEENVRLLYSVSNFRNKNVDSNLLGRANKCLHWFDIRTFKDKKIKILDWGGVSDFDNPNGIDKFKLGFGGEKLIYNNIMIGKSLLGKLIIKVLKIKRGLN